MPSELNFFFLHEIGKVLVQSIDSLACVGGLFKAIVLLWRGAETNVLVVKSDIAVFLVVQQKVVENVVLLVFMADLKDFEDEELKLASCEHSHELKIVPCEDFDIHHLVVSEN